MPIVNALVAVAVTVVELPKDTVLPLIVIELLVNDELPMFDSVLLDPSIDDVEIVVPAIVPPVIATEVAFCVDIVPKPVIAVFGMVALAVNDPVPLPIK